MNKPSKKEVLEFLAVVEAVKPPKTYNGKIRVVAKYFHLSSKEILSIINRL